MSSANRTPPRLGEHDLQRRLHLKVVYINADSAVERKQHMETMLKEVQLTGDRLAAFVYANLTDADVLRTLGHPMSALTLNPRVQQRLQNINLAVAEKNSSGNIAGDNISGYWNMTEAKASRWVGGTVVCYLSHVAAMLKLNASLLPHELGLIMEDDVRVRKDWAARLERLLNVVPSDWCLLKVNGWGPGAWRGTDHVDLSSAIDARCKNSTNAAACRQTLETLNIYRTNPPFKTNDASGQRTFYGSAGGYVVRKEKLSALLNQVRQPYITDFDEALLSTSSCVAYEVSPYIVELAPEFSEKSTFHN